MQKSNKTISGLRFQKYDTTGEVHVHDDSKSIKFISTANEFKKDIKDALKQLKQDGAIIIEGTSKEKLILIKEDKKFSIIVTDDTNIISELNTFISTL